MQQVIDLLKAELHASTLAQYPWVERVLTGVIDFITGPITGTGTRYYWVFLAEALVVLLIVNAIRGGSLAGFFRFCFPRGTLRHRSTWVDLQINLANQIFGRSFKLFWWLSIPAITAAGVSGLEHVFGPAPHLWHFSTITLFILTVLVTIADDFGYYVFHSAAHRFAWLWAFHKLHHSAEVLTPIVAGRVHPVEMALSEPVRAAAAATILVPAFYLSAGEPTLVTVYGINVMSLLFGALGNQLLHSQVPLSWGPKLDRILVSPSVHQIHHSSAPRHHNRNMGGLLSVWDWMFGTLCLPEPGEQLHFGLEEGKPQAHPTIVAAYAVPFWEVLAHVWVVAGRCHATLRRWPHAHAAAAAEPMEPR